MKIGIERFITVITLMLLIFIVENAHSQQLGEVLERHAIPFDGESDIVSVIDLIGDERLILMGEASHGTSEFYRKRAVLSKELIRERGIDFIAVEGDWASFSRINEYVKQKDGGPSSLEEAMNSLNRWPHWMWRNSEFKSLVQWLYEFNLDRLPEDRVGLYGIDVYANEAAMEDVVNWISSVDSRLGRRANSAYSCLSRHSEIGNYLQMVNRTGQHCGSDMQEVLEIVRGLKDEPGVSRWDFFKAEHGALVAINAELHYRANLEQNSASWNYRAEHFYLTAERLLEQYGEESRGIIWAHNTHIGDARATDMARFGMVNIGQLSRDHLGHDKVYAIGFGTHEGRVLAAYQWEGAMVQMEIPSSASGTWEYELMSLGHEKLYLDLRRDELQEALSNRIPHRAIGVTYNPAADRNNFVPSTLPERYDLFIFFNRTDVLDPLD